MSPFTLLTENYNREKKEREKGTQRAFKERSTEKQREREKDENAKLERE